MEQYRRQIEAIKLSVIGLPSVAGLTVNQLLIESIDFLYSSFVRTKQKKLLLHAAVQIQAYLEMGFVYEDSGKLFDKVLEELGTEKKILFPKKFYMYRKIKLNRNAVRNMIKRWPKTNERDFTIDELVNDIINKVKNKESGIYFYTSTRKNGSSVIGMYELVINSSECYFHDLVCKKYYVFEKN